MSVVDALHVVDNWAVIFLGLRSDGGGTRALCNGDILKLRGIWANCQVLIGLEVDGICIGEESANSGDHCNVEETDFHYFVWVVYW